MNFQSLRRFYHAKVIRNMKIVYHAKVIRTMEITKYNRNITHNSIELSSKPRIERSSVRSA